MAYLTLAEFKLLSTMQSESVDELETRWPGYVDAQLDSKSHWINAQLRKRYAAPFESPYPAAVKSWLACIVTMQCWKRRGYDPTDESMQEAIEDRAEAKREIAEAADGEKGLWDLPLRSDTTATGISKGAPLGYSEQSPYVGFDLQRETGREEDSNGSGTS